MKIKHLIIVTIVILSMFVTGCAKAKLSGNDVKSDASLVEWNGHIYGITSQNDSWENAEAYAVSKGGHLVTIDDDAESIFIQNTFLAGNSVDEEFWIGLTCPSPLNYLDTLNWSWVDGSAVTYNNWRTGQPDKGFGNDRYVAINYLGGSNNQWDNFPTKSNYMFRGIYEITS